MDAGGAAGFAVAFGVGFFSSYQRISRQNGAQVIEIVGGSSHPRQEFVGGDFRLHDRYELAKAVADTLDQTEDFSDKAALVRNCHLQFRHWRCRENCDFAEAENSCSCRVCPHCARRRSLILAERIEECIADKLFGSLRYLVLSERNSAAGDLDRGIDSLNESWTRLRRSKTWKNYCKGSVAVLEVTVNEKDGSWHPHLNVLMEGDYFPWEQLQKLWVKATRGRGEIVYIRAADSGTVGELMKYVTKVADLVGKPKALNEFLLAVKGRRLVKKYGSFYNVQVADEDAPRLHKCPCCGCSEITKLGIVPREQVIMDFNGNLRVQRDQRHVDRELIAAVSLEWVPCAEQQESRAIRHELDSFIALGVVAQHERESWNRHLVSEW